MANALSVEPPAPLRSFRHQGLDIHVYDSPESMGKASAIQIAERQVELAAQQPAVSLLLMAAPSAFPFYQAYGALAATSAPLQEAIAQTHYFQFDEYPLPETHPASFRYLLNERFFAPLREWLTPENIHLLGVDADDPVKACGEYARAVLDMGPDLQLKGMGENGHWGFHEPEIPLNGEAAYMRVTLSAENAAQQLRDHPDLYRDAEDVPREAYTANVPLFLRTRHLIEDNVPQSSKAFALLAAYGNDVVHASVPSSALKRHPRGIVRTTQDASWALEEYIGRGSVPKKSLKRLIDSLNGDESTRKWVAGVLRDMNIAMDT